jgi:hypothetical protein
MKEAKILSSPEGGGRKAISPILEEEDNGDEQDEEKDAVMASPKKSPSRRSCSQQVRADQVVKKQGPTFLHRFLMRHLHRQEQATQTE